MKNKLTDITDREFQEALDTSDSYRQLLFKLNLATNGTSYDLIKKEIQKRNLDKTKFDILQKVNLRVQNYTPEQIFKKNSPIGKITKFLIKFNLKDISKCEICGISEWMGKPIIIQIHHKDGDHYNNELDNLQALCPNCHSQTKNFGSKNDKGISEFKKNENKICVDCGNEVYGNNIRCSDCNLKYKLKIAKFPKKKKLLEYISKAVKIDELIKEYDVDKSIVISWFKEYNLWEKYEKTQKLSLEEKTKRREKYIKQTNCIRIVNFSEEKKAEFRQELKEKIRNIPFLQIGKEYNVTDNAVRKWCKHLNLPYRRRDINKISNEDWEKI